MQVREKESRNHPTETLLRIENLKVEFGTRTVFENLNFSLKKGEKLALAGPNGAGKTTLIKTIMGISESDSGKITKKNNLRISYIPQSSDDINLDPQSTIENYLLKSSGLLEIQSQIQQIYTALEKEPGNRDLLTRLGELQTEFEHLGGYEITARFQKVLTGMGMNDVEMNTRFENLSGGQKTKVFIAEAIAAEPDILILDEPTNNIDKEALDWLGDYLSTFRQSVIVVSHNPGFLDRFVKRVVEINPQKSGITEYNGNYTEFVLKKNLEDSLRLREINRLIKSKENDEDVGNRLRAGSSSGVGKARLIRAEKTQQEINDLSQNLVIRSGKKLDINFGVENLGPRIVLKMSGVKVEIDGHEMDFSGLNMELTRGKRLLIDGKTGSGKSLLLELIIGHIKASSGKIFVNEGVNIGYYAQKHNDVNFNNDLISEICSVDPKISTEKARSILGHFLFSGDEQKKKTKVLSQGELSRLALAKLVVGRNNLLLIDEPTNHLDINSRERLIESLKSYNGTMIVVSQDTDFLEKINIDECLFLPSCEILNY